MRNIINISIPAQMKKEVDLFVKEGNYASVSEFIRDMIRNWKKQKLLDDLKHSHEEFKKGKAKKFVSFRAMR